MKLGLEEWRHWLEGAKLPFLVWTDYKNLEYISSAERLNSRQAQWALFFTCLISLFLIALDPGIPSRMPFPGSLWWNGTKWGGPRTVWLSP